jgi:hypothetical protein
MMNFFRFRENKNVRDLADLLFEESPIIHTEMRRFSVPARLLENKKVKQLNSSLKKREIGNRNTLKITKMTGFRMHKKAVCL